MDDRSSDRERYTGRHEDEQRSRSGDRGEWRGGDQRDRGFLERAGDEVRTWFGDEEAQRRRIQDEQRYGDQRWSGQRGQSWGPQRGQSYGAERGWESHGQQRHGEERSWGGYGGSYGSQGYGSERAQSGAGSQYGGGQAYGPERGPGRQGGSWSQGYGQEGFGSRGYGGSQGYGTERGFGEQSGFGSPGYGGQSYGGDRFDQSEGSQRWSGQGGGGIGQPGGMGGGYGSGSFEGERRSGEWGSVSGPYTGRGPKGYQRSDERIKEDICERLTQHGQLDASDLEVRVTNCEVTIQGTVRNRQDKRTAEDIAESVSGVKEVHNQIRVGQSGHWQQGTQAGEGSRFGQHGDQSGQQGGQSGYRAA